jgi:hypothetical protein
MDPRCDLQLTLTGSANNSAELTYEKYIRSEWSGATADALREQARQERDEWVSMSPREKATRWAVQNRYKMVAGA